MKRIILLALLMASILFGEVKYYDFSIVVGKLESVQVETGEFTEVKIDKDIMLEPVFRDSTYVTVTKHHYRANSIVQIKRIMEKLVDSFDLKDLAKADFFNTIYIYDDKAKLVSAEIIHLNNNQKFKDYILQLYAVKNNKDVFEMSDLETK